MNTYWKNKLICHAHTAYSWFFEHLTNPHKHVQSPCLSVNKNAISKNAIIAVWLLKSYVLKNATPFLQFCLNTPFELWNLNVKRLLLAKPQYRMVIMLTCISQNLCSILSLPLACSLLNLYQSLNETILFFKYAKCANHCLCIAILLYIRYLKFKSTKHTKI